MIFRTLMMLAALFMLTACPSTKDGADMGETVVIQEPVTGFEGDTMMAEPLGGPTPGTEDHFRVSVGDRVFFGYDRYDLTAEAQRTLEMQAEWLKRYPGFSLTVEGHCDERGTREYNLALGERRANAVKSYLVALGISPNRIETISYGKEMPAVEGTGPSVWAQNRRGVTDLK